MNIVKNKTLGVIWISGYSASGKTTVGRHVEQILRFKGYPTLFLDGDELRSIFASKWGYSLDERVELALIYFRLCSHLAKQGLIVILSAVAMFDIARQWFKQNVENGIEVYLRVPLQERIRRDTATKNIYSKEKLSMEQYSESINPDLVIDNYGETNYGKASQIIVEKFMTNINIAHVDYGRAQYWTTFYKNKLAVNIPSPFAEYCLTKFVPGKNILEIGCGNGRDARFFAQIGYNVIAIDKSEFVINDCISGNPLRSLTYICCEASEVPKYVSGQYNYIYSRFSLHAMTEIEEINALKSFFNLLESNGLLCIECRSINDPLARRGEVLSPTERVDGHYRRFIILEELIMKLVEIGFSIIESIESTGLAVFGDEDPVVIRVIATKC